MNTSLMAPRRGGGCSLHITVIRVSHGPSFPKATGFCSVFVGY